MTPVSDYKRKLQLIKILKNERLIICVKTLSYTFAMLTRSIVMTGKRNIAWTLIFACVVMLLAVAFPHHHHHDLTLCMHADLHTCGADCTKGEHHHQPYHECQNGCVAFFQSSMPQPAHHINPDYSFFVYLDSLKDCFRIVLFENHAIEYPEDRPERLISPECWHTGGLRAPPQA